MLSTSVPSGPHGSRVSPSCLVPWVVNSFQNTKPIGLRMKCSALHMCPCSHATTLPAPALRVRHFLAVQMSFVVLPGLAALCCRYRIHLKKERNQCFAVLSNLVSLKMHYLVDMLANSLEVIVLWLGGMGFLLLGH